MAKRKVLTYLDLEREKQRKKELREVKANTKPYSIIAYNRDDICEYLGIKDKRTLRRQEKEIKDRFGFSLKDCILSDFLKAMDYLIERYK